MEEKLICQYCGKECEDKSALTNHIRYYCQLSTEKVQKIKPIVKCEPYICERCGKEVTELYGSSRFCSRACSNARDHSEETKRKISIGVSEKFKDQNKTETIDIYCKACGKKIKINKTGYCSQCLWHSQEAKDARSSISRKGAMTAKNNNNIVGWRPRNIRSYPEQFWDIVLNNNINYIGTNYSVRQESGYSYFLDYYIEKDNYKIDLEIDGKQHKLKDRIEFDKKRDAYLTTLGYIVYRVELNSIKSKSGKVLMENKINNFIKWYTNLI